MANAMDTIATLDADKDARRRSALTQAQAAALKWLEERGGAGVVDNRGRLMARGEATGKFAPVTWLRLVGLGLIVSDGNGRFYVKATLSPLRESEHG